MAEEEKIEGNLVPLNVLHDFHSPSKKADIAYSIKDAIMGGNVEPAFAGVGLKRLGDAIEIVLKDKEVREVIKNDTIKHFNGGKKAFLLDAEVTLAATYTAYDFSICGHPEYDEWVKILTKCKERMKEIEDEIKLQLKEYERKEATNSLTISANTKSYIIQELPVLTMKSSGEVADVRIPNKIQSIGLKYSKT